ncbi:DUF2975 domain-containing protein [Maribacter sp. BPC-D8]|uniref:DUF2975 domain-containing protein n=1 Tax=Maribacter sp. BPC-D8 TaxID=3053613 RepID=UPI002B475E88|nr:DUF2975 domain-containing protein [Maribacter sp. BPC-D8]WRI29037.1 DUF2975 domain-containing protein [Maribacter sp. BPC-D8]
MKIFGPKSLSAFFYFIFRSVSIVLLTFLIYMEFAFITDRFTVNNGRFNMKIPLSGSSIDGNYQSSDILTISLILIFGILLLYLLSNIFKALKQTVIFNKGIIKNLKLLTILNLIIGPVLYFLIQYPIMHHNKLGNIHNLILLVIFGMISLFLTYVFQKGFSVQSENDLTI